MGPRCTGTVRCRGPRRSQAAACLVLLVKNDELEDVVVTRVKEVIDAIDESEVEHLTVEAETTVLPLASQTGKCVDSHQVPDLSQPGPALP